MVEKLELEVMDSVTKFRKTETYSISKSLAIFILCLFVTCLVAAGILGYSVSSCDSYNNVEEKTETELKSVVLCENGVQTTSTTTTTTTSATTTTTAKAKTTESSKKTEKKLNLRLPRSIVPHSYKLKLIPFLEEGNFTFKGEVRILLNVTQNCKNITLNAEKLNIFHVEVFTDFNKTIQVSNRKLEKDLDFLVIELSEELHSRKQYYVHIKFEGVLNNFMQGFYRSSYKENNVTKWIALTQFQPTDARKAFPCFDEPALKARFQISIARLKHMHTVSNMRIIAVSEGGPDLPGFEWDHYEETLPMSSYLLAFMVSDFKSVSNGSVSIFARSGAIRQVDYALSIAPKILKFYEDFFGIKYPLPKLDMAAIPDFSAGAMENWGLITYREPALLYTEGVSSVKIHEKVAHIVAHELAHQWFGNLVTPFWWSDLWLNEGFATYVEYLGAGEVGPEWKEQDTFVVHEIQSSFELDALKTSHPISVPVNNPDEVNDLFDTISYSKGASIIRMMNHFLTESVFHKALNKYLSSRMYSSAAQDDLWGFMSEQGHLDGTLDKSMSVKEIMDTWTLQIGYPVVQVTRDYLDSSVVFRQSRFSLDGTINGDSTLWWIPITYTDTASNFATTWLKKTPETKIEDLKTSSEDWILVNINQTGYYRVNYDLDNWRMIVDQLLTPNGHFLIDPKNRAQIMDDLFDLAYSDYVSYELALNASLYLRQEREFVPWESAKSSLTFLMKMFERSPHFDKFKSYAISLLGDFYKEVDFKDLKDVLKSKTHFTILDLACALGVRDCIIKSVQLFQNWKNSANPDDGINIPRDMRYLVYCEAIKDGGQEEWDFAWQRYLKVDAGIEKEILLASLGCTKEVWLLNRFLEWSITENSGIRKHDVATVFTAATTGPVGYDLTYRFLKTNWDRIRNYVGRSSLSLGMIISISIQHLNTEMEVNDFKNFLKLKQNEFGVALRTTLQTLEQCEVNVKWRKKHFNTIVKWLSKRTI